MSEINLCLQKGCKGGCCTDITIYDGEEVILKTFPDAKEVNAWELQNAIQGQAKKGVYYQYDGRNPKPGMAIARISGLCPNKSESGNCLVHHSCSHAAENFQIDSPECLNIRKQLGLD